MIGIVIEDDHFYPTGEQQTARNLPEAAKSGSMSSLRPPKAPSGAAGSQAAAAQAYSHTASSTSGSNPMSTLDGIISGALSGVGSTEA